MKVLKFPDRLGRKRKRGRTVRVPRKSGSDNEVFQLLSPLALMNLPIESSIGQIQPCPFQQQRALHYK
jgi:hypothetical protein